MINTAKMQNFEREIPVLVFLIFEVCCKVQPFTPDAHAQIQSHDYEIKTVILYLGVQTLVVTYVGFV